MKILLVQVVDPERTEDAVFPTGLGYIAAFLRQEMSGRVEIQIAQHNLRHVVETFQPDVIGISTVTQNYDHAKLFSNWCKAYRSDIIIIIGGHHISALPETLVESMDLAVMGEGEITMLQVCQIIEQSGLDWSALQQVAGIVYRDQAGAICKTDPRELIRDLDILPFPARDLMHIKSGEAIGIISSRGCPYHCVFCASRSFWKTTRFHSAEYVVREVESVIEQYSPKHIYFWDDLFIADRKRLKKIVSLLKEKDIVKRVKFSLNCRANLVDQELMQILIEMNVFEVSVGFESFSVDTLAFLKDHVTVQDNWRAIELLSQAHIHILGFFIIGSPRETHKEIQETLAAFKDARLHRAQAYLLTPLPGTPIWNYAIQQGLVSLDMDWNKLYIDAPDDVENGIVLSKTIESSRMRQLLQEFQVVRKSKERKIKIQKLFYYVRLVFVEPGTVFELVKKAWTLWLYKARYRWHKILAKN